MSKELWFAEYERLLAAGYHEDRAADLAYDAMVDRLADAADNMRKRAKEEGRNARVAEPLRGIINGVSGGEK